MDSYISEKYHNIRAHLFALLIFKGTAPQLRGRFIPYYQTSTSHQPHLFSGLAQKMIRVETSTVDAQPYGAHSITRSYPTSSPNVFRCSKRSYNHQLQPAQRHRIFSPRRCQTKGHGLRKDRFSVPWIETSGFASSFRAPRRRSPLQNNL
jgi:hypothetical protein